MLKMESQWRMPNMYFSRIGISDQDTDDGSRLDSEAYKRKYNHWTLRTMKSIMEMFNHSELGLSVRSYLTFEHL